MFFVFFSHHITALKKNKNTNHGNEVPPQDTTHLIQRPCYQRGSPCQDPAGNRITRRPPDHREETQTAEVTSLALCPQVLSKAPRHFRSSTNQGKKTRGKKTRQTEEEVGRKRRGMDRPGVRQVPEGSGEHGKMEETCCEIICGVPPTLTVKGYQKKKMMMMMVMF